MLGAALGWSLVAILTRRLGASEDASTMLLYTLLGFAVTMVWPQFWIWQPVAAADLGLIAVLAVFGVAAQFSLIKAYSIAAPSAVAPFEYSGLLLGSALRLCHLGRLSGPAAVAGAALIVASGLFIIYQEARLLKRMPGR